MSQDLKNKDVIVICLDTYDLISANVIAIDTKNTEKCTENLINILIEGFVSKSIDYLNQKTDLIKIFENKSCPKEYWDKFNEIKQKSYVNDLKKFFERKTEKKGKVITRVLKKILII